jgi:L-fuculose-phosphate aldolase
LNVSEIAIIDEIIETGKLLKRNGLICSTDGNISVRNGDNIYITPGGYDKGGLRRNEIIKLDINKLNYNNDNKIKPSMEVNMHLHSYMKDKIIKAIVHTHAPFSTAFASKGILPDRDRLLESELLPDICIIDDYEPGSIELANEVSKKVKDYHIMLLKRHGVIVFSESLKVAYETIERFEFLCRINLYSKLL